MDIKTDVHAGIEAGMLLGDVRRPSPEARPFVLVPGHAKIEDLERLLPQPTRKSGTVTLNDHRSFVRYVLEENVPGTRIYGSVTPKPVFTAVFNDHAGNTEASAGRPLSPGWRDHRAVYACPLSREWTIWNGASGKQMDQAAFAAFLEDNLPDIAEPAAADMLEIARSLEAKKRVNFASGLRLSNGQTQLTYEETIEGTAAKGRIHVPETFALGIAVLEGGDRYRVEARLRYRIADGGKLTMWFDLLRPHKVLEDAANFVWQAIEAETGLKVFNGVA